MVASSTTTSMSLSTAVVVVEADVCFNDAGADWDIRTPTAAAAAAADVGSPPMDDEGLSLTLLPVVLKPFAGVGEDDPR